MKLFIVAVDEPIYLNPYVRAVIDDSGADVVGVGLYRPSSRPWTRRRLRRMLAQALLACLVFSPANLVRIGWWRIRALAGVGAGRSLPEICATRRVPCSRVESANAPAFLAMLRSLDVDVLLHQSPEILKGALLRTPNIGVVNRHLSALPAYRGAWPMFWQFVNGERELGVSIHLVDEGIDTGAVLAQATIERRPGDTLATAHERLFPLAAPLTRDALARLARGDRGTAADPRAGVCYRTPTPRDVLSFMFGRRRVSVSARA